MWFLFLILLWSDFSILLRQPDLHPPSCSMSRSFPSSSSVRPAPARRCRHQHRRHLLCLSNPTRNRNTKIVMFRTDDTARRSEMNGNRRNIITERAFQKTMKRKRTKEINTDRIATGAASRRFSLLAARSFRVNFSYSFFFSSEKERSF